MSCGPRDRDGRAESVWEGSASEEICVQFRFGWIKLQIGIKTLNGTFLNHINSPPATDGILYIGKAAA